MKAWLVNYDGVVEHTLYNGEGYHAPPVHRNYDLVEDLQYTITVCLVDGEHDKTPFDCEVGKIRT